MQPPTTGRAEVLRQRLASFMDRHIYPAEAVYARQLDEAPTRWSVPSVMEELKAKAREEGLWNLFLPRREFPDALTNVEYAPLCEIMGRSPIAAEAFNCSAPDTGNMETLALYGTAEQKEAWLKPLMAGEIRSCFAMTEPAPGAGSDPRALATTATRVPGGWRIDGRKWFISGADGAGFAICMARTSGSPGDPGGATMFLVDAGTPGMKLVRNLETLDEGLFGGHSELVFDGCFVADGQVLGEVDEGFRYAQVRLGPARLTHCMRWLGAARRARDLALERAATRSAFGRPLAELGMVQQLLADNEIDIEASRALLWRACWELDQGRPGAQHTSITKTFVSEAVNRVVDRAVQVCGALGISADLPLSRLLREVRPFRIYDGPSETHRWAIARRAVRSR